MKVNEKSLARQNDLATIQLSKDQQMFIVTGFLNFKHIVQLREQGDQLFKNFPASEIQVDLSEIKGSDNSGLVLLVAWVRSAKREGKLVHFHFVPDFLLRMSQVFGLQKILFKTSF